MTYPLPTVLPTSPEQCASLGEWRQWGLGLSQTQVGLRANVQQGRISDIEGGRKTPLRCHWRALMAAYQIADERTWHKFLLAAVAAKALKTPVAESHPLLASGSTGTAAAAETIAQPQQGAQSAQAVSA